MDPAAEKVADDAIIDGAMQNEGSVERQFGGQRHDVFVLDVMRREAKFLIVAKAKIGIGVARDRRIQDRAAMGVAIRREIGATAGKALPQRRARERSGPMYDAAWRSCRWRPLFLRRRNQSAKRPEYSRHPHQPKRNIMA
jgi:hypothetical protein